MIIFSNIAINLQVIITAASKISQDGRASWKPTAQGADADTLTEGSVGMRSPSKSLKVMTGLLALLIQLLIIKLVSL